MRWIACLVIVAACGGSKPGTQSPSPAGDVTEQRSVMGRGRKIGRYEITRQTDGTFKLMLDVLQNGRGPHVDATLALDARGLPTAFRATGHHEFLTKLDEAFARDGDKARWKSLEEQGEAGAGGAFYLPLAPAPMSHWLVTAALAAGGTLPLLPTGQVRVEKAGSMTVSAGGQTKQIVAYAITGLDFARRYVWFDESSRWFGTFYSWRAYVPEGWESVVDAVVAKQDDFERAGDRAIYAATAKRPPAAGLALTHARVLDVEHGTWLADHTVVIIGDTIKAVGPAAKVQVPAGAEVIDLKGQAIVPGMIDMHTHLDRTDGILNIAAGVTTARDVGNDPDQIDNYKTWFDEGSAVGPRLVRMGFIEGRNELAAASKVTAETAEEAKAAVEFFAKRGYEGIKIYNSMKPELVPILTEAAHAKGMLVTGHIPVHMLAHEAVRAGYDGIEHINMLFLNFFATHDTDTRTPLRFTLVGDQATSLDLASKPVQDFFALLRERKTVVTPTCVAFEDLLVGEAGKIIPGREAVVARMPPVVQREQLVNGLPMEGDKRALYRAAFDRMLAMVKALYDAKIPVLVGTDWYNGLGAQQELLLFARAGIPNAAILRLATLDAARAMKLEGKLGSIAPGKAADLFVVPGDPLADMAAVRDVRMTVSRGVVFDSAKLLGFVGVKPN